MTEFTTLFTEIRALIERWGTAENTERRLQEVALTVAFLCGTVGIMATRLDGLDRMVSELLATELRRRA